MVSAILAGSRFYARIRPIRSVVQVYTLILRNTAVQNYNLFSNLSTSTNSMSNKSIVFYYTYAKTCLHNHLLLFTYCLACFLALLLTSMLSCTLPAVNHSNICMSQKCYFENQKDLNHNYSFLLKICNMQFLWILSLKLSIYFCSVRKQ